MKILVIDETAMLGVITKALTERGHHVETAAGGRLGVEKFENGHFEVVVTNMVMPDLEGKSVVQTVRNSDTNSAWIIVMSEAPQKINREQFDAVLTKPFSMGDLLQCIDGLSS